MKFQKNYLLSYIICIVAIVSLATSCSKDFTKRNPYDSISEGDALTDEASLSAALNGVYSTLRSSNLFGRDLLIIGDLQADNTFIETKNSGRYLPQFQYNATIASAVPSEIWSNAYTAILRANRIIDADVSGAGVAAIKAQAYALRALMYFKLVNIYARPYTDNPSGSGVPLILHYDPYNLPQRNTVQEVYTQIISDYNTALTNAGDYTSSVFLSNYAIEGLLANAYFYMNDMQKAKDAAVDVINNSDFTLVSLNSYRSYWNNSAPRTDAVETLFEVDADVVNNNGFDDIGAIYENGYQDIYASMQLYNLYNATDVRTSVVIQGETKNGADAILVDKYPNSQSDDRDNLKVMRLSEVYLIAAEASARLGDQADALLYLNDLMAKRDPSLTYTASGDQLVDNIILERRKELAFEGNRLYDLNRLMLPVERVSNVGSLPPGMLSIPYSDIRRIAPIPQDEIQANPNLATQQNPGY